MNNSQVSVIAPGKINLYLDIVGIREDGYHLLEMVMQTITLADELRLRQSGDGIRLTCSRPDLPTGSDNIVWKAAELFYQHTGMTPGIEIALTKNIPMEAGLGGGSADAAAALLGLNQLYETRIPQRVLRELGSKLGADVPFCMAGGTAQAYGIGEFIEESTPLPDCYIVLAKPVQGISTREAFQKFDQLNIPVPHGKLEDILASLAAKDLKGVCGSLYNTFEFIHEQQEITAILTMMRQCGALGCLMSGSGSSCFGVFSEKLAAKRCYRRLKEISHSVFLCRPCRHGSLPL